MKGEISSRKGWKSHIKPFPQPENMWLDWGLNAQCLLSVWKNCMEETRKECRTWKIPSSHIIKSRKFRHGSLKGPGFLPGGEMRKTPIPLDLLGIDHADEDTAADSWYFISAWSTKEPGSVLPSGIWGLIAKMRQIYQLREVQCSWLRRASQIHFW